MRTLTRLFLLAVMGLTLQACDSSDGPAERAGEAVDNAAGEAADAAERAADRAQDAVDRITQ